jgi:DNA-binding MarR family transcriptional regulator
MKKVNVSAPKGDAQVLLKHWQELGTNDRLAHLVKDGSRAMVRALQIRLIEHNVPFGHWTYLRKLWQKDGITQRALSEEAGVMDSTTYSALIAMEKLGYIVRKQLGDNKKNNYIFLTETGRALEKKLVPLAEEVNTISVRGIKTADINATRRVLLAILENLADEEINSNNSERRMPSTREVGRLIFESGEQQKKLY